MAVEVAGWARSMPRTVAELHRNMDEWNSTIRTIVHQAKDAHDDSSKDHFRRQAESLRREYDAWLSRADRF